MKQRCREADEEEALGLIPSARDEEVNTLLRGFADMVDHAYAYACAEKAKGRPLIGILCEYTPREIILAAGGIPVGLCGGDADMIPSAEEFLPAGLCPLIKSTLGYSLRRENPFLEMADLVVGETTCDGKKKMYEHLSRQRPMVVLDLPQKPGEPAALAHWVAELRALARDLERRFKARVTPHKLREAISLMNRERSLRRRLAQLMAGDSPPLTGRELLNMKSIISCIPADLEAYARALDVLPGRRLDPPARDRVRVLLTGVPVPHGAERVMDIIEDHGGLVVVQENCTGLKPILEDVDENAEDPMRGIAEKYLRVPCSVMTPNPRRIDGLRSLAETYRPQCVIELTWHGCITYEVESFWVRAWARDELGVPYLHVDTDYSPSDSNRIATRVQALFETVRDPGSSAGDGRMRLEREEDDD